MKNKQNRYFSNPSFAAIENRRQFRYARGFIWTYWSVIGAHFLAQLFAFLFLPYEAAANYFYLHILFNPTLLMCGITAVAHSFLVKAERFSFPSIFVAGTLISMVIVHLNMDIRIIAAVMLLPIFASTLFFRLSLTWFTAALQVVGFSVLFRWDIGFRSFMSDFDLIAIVLFFALSTVAASFIIVSGRDLVIDLEAAMIAQQQLLVEKTVMSQRSKTDALTNLYNHMSFHDFYDKAIEFADRGAPFHLALIDIDNFKSINDTFGHRVGDTILATVARVIKDRISPADIASRYGGEEFALLLFEQSFEEAYALVDGIRAELAESYHPELDGRAVTVSVGIKSYSNAFTKEKLFEDVDALLYEAKRAGKNKVASEALTV
ncbi:diguanylate cyclase (GGDEF) domain-containing protein [Cohnella sp. OV330]|uniref:GGDEF domain-containing protein n=1 Tax=Cohnella sp. OV330 TaxID=1855288 RepID=UPI0008E49F2B|nr:GGDEF domain-containing protein [Cohnella sp. OV330]SFB41390.1 diguanylate cyclase (GGDEF) domain-containing protein [Cohnella sp. OV330]